MTWSACRTFSYSRSRGFQWMAARWERSRPRASDPSSRKNSRPPGLTCRQTCLSKRLGAGTEDRIRDMSLILLFLLLLILMFGVLVYLLKPTAMEKAVEDQLASIAEVHAVPRDRVTILKERAVRSTAVEKLAQRLPWSPSASRLIKQAGKNWSLGSVSVFSLIAGLAAYGLASLVNASFIASILIGVAVGSAPYVYLHILRKVGLG